MKIQLKILSAPRSTNAARVRVHLKCKILKDTCMEKAAVWNPFASVCPPRVGFVPRVMSIRSIRWDTGNSLEVEDV